MLSPQYFLYGMEIQTLIRLKLLRIVAINRVARNVYLKRVAKCLISRFITASERGIRRNSIQSHEGKIHGE